MDGEKHKFARGKALVCTWQSISLDGDCVQVKTLYGEGSSTKESTGGAVGAAKESTGTSGGLPT